jgi:hypothetical protein
MSFFIALFAARRAFFIEYSSFSFLDPLRINKMIAIRTATTAPIFIKVGRLPALTLFMKVGVGAVRFTALAIG